MVLSHVKISYIKFAYMFFMCKARHIKEYAEMLLLSVMAGILKFL